MFKVIVSIRECGYQCVYCDFVLFFFDVIDVFKVNRCLIFVIVQVNIDGFVVVDLQVLFKFIQIEQVDVVVCIYVVVVDYVYLDIFVCGVVGLGNDFGGNL